MFIFSSIVSFFTKFFLGISSKTIILSFVFLSIISIIASGFIYVTTLQKHLTKAKTDLILETIRANQAEVVFKGYQTQHNLMIKNIELFESRQLNSQFEIDKLNDSADDIKLNMEITNDKDKQNRLNNLNSRTRELNSLLKAN